MSTKKLQIVGTLTSQSDWNQTDETQRKMESYTLSMNEVKQYG